ncbi:hypothetical protein DTO207G8_6254 [Paecilomyces variotii]|nr:hypothetical protein DTO207G8_6254 [Paecilomyces variotii]KAJ9360418.1 hypothetical protein DTO027B9_1402 [Paecilomyces variotii]KAJ9406759.1 hypothetical protein DTO045G8_5425 [Paecilomyces variotii]
MSHSEKPVVGARVIRSTNETNNGEDTIAIPPVAQTLPPANTHSPNSESADEMPDFDPRVGAKPYSPFYSHADTKPSEEHLKVDVKIISREYSSQDLESGGRSAYKQSVDLNRASKIWAKEDKRHCGWFDAMTKEQRLAVKVFLALLIVGGMIATHEHKRCFVQLFFDYIYILLTISSSRRLAHLHARRPDMRRHSIAERDASVSDKSSHFVIPIAFVICEGKSAITKITA